MEHNHVMGKGAYGADVRRQCDKRYSRMLCLLRLKISLLVIITNVREEKELNIATWLW